MPFTPGSAYSGQTIPLTAKYGYSNADGLEGVPSGTEGFLEYNNLIINDRNQADRYWVTEIGGIDDADVIDAREKRPQTDGEFVYDAWYGGRTITLTGHIASGTKAMMRKMAEDLRSAFGSLNESPLKFRWWDFFEEWVIPNCINNYTRDVGTALSASNGFLFPTATTEQRIYRSADQRRYTDCRQTIRINTGVSVSAATVGVIHRQDINNGLFIQAIFASGASASTVGIYSLNNNVLSSALASATFTANPMNAYWLRGTKIDNLITAEIFPFDPYGISSSPYKLTYSQAVLSTANLTGFWKLGDVTTTALDSNDSMSGTLSGGYTQSVPGIIGDASKSTSFNGSTGLVTISDTANNQLNADFTLEAWVFVSSYSANYGPIIARRSAAGWNEYALRLDSLGTPQLVLGASSSSETAYPANSRVPLSTWTHLAVVVQGSTYSHYINGTLNGSGTYSQVRQLGTTPVRLASDSVNFFNGRLLLISMYKGRALAQSEIQAHYTSGLSTPGFGRNGLASISASTTLTGFNADNRGAGVIGDAGLRIISPTDWTYYDYRMESISPGDVISNARKVAPISMHDAQQKQTYFRRDFQITMRASNPRFINNVKQYAVISPTSGVFQPIHCVNKGNFPCQPIIRVYGAITTASIQNLTNGNTLSFNSVVVDGQYVDIDIENHTLLWSSGASAYNLFTAHSDWIVLDPGPNDILMTGFSYSGNTMLRVSWNNTFI